MVRPRKRGRPKGSTKEKENVVKRTTVYNSNIYDDINLLAVAIDISFNQIVNKLLAEAIEGNVLYVQLIENMKLIRENKLIKELNSNK